MVEVRCAAETRRIELVEAAASDEVCGGQVGWSAAVDIYTAPSGSVRFEVTWESKSASD